MERIIGHSWGGGARRAVRYNPKMSLSYLSVFLGSRARIVARALDSRTGCAPNLPRIDR
jgi:hypothetical protein